MQSSHHYKRDDDTMLFLILTSPRQWPGCIVFGLLCLFVMFVTMLNLLYIRLEAALCIPNETI